MPVPSTARPDTFSPVNWSGDVCSQLRELFAVNERLNILFSWMFDDDGNPTDEFLGDLQKWVYGPLVTTGSDGAYVIVSTPPYSTVNAAPVAGRVVYFKANHDSPSGGSTLKLDDWTAYPLLDKFGASIGTKGISNGMYVHAIYDGGSFYVLNELSKAGATFVTSRSFDETSQREKTSYTDFPVTMSITFTKPAGAIWEVIDLWVVGSFGTNSAVGTMSCDIKFAAGGPSGGSSVSAETGSSNLDQVYKLQTDNDTVSCPWHCTFEMPSSYQTENTVTFDAILTITGTPGFPTLDFDQNFHGVAKYIRQQS